MPKSRPHKSPASRVLVRSTLDRLPPIIYLPDSTGSRQDVVKLAAQNIVQKILAHEIEIEVEVMEPSNVRRDWKSSTADYPKLTAVTFERDRDMAGAFHPFFDEKSELYQAPLRSVGERTVFIPREAEALFETYLKDKGVKAFFSAVLSRLEERRMAASIAPQ